MGKATFPITTGHESSKPVVGTSSPTDMVNLFSSLFQGDKAPLRPRAQATPDMTIAVDASLIEAYFSQVWLGATSPLNYAGGNSPALTAPSANPRISLLTIDSSGTLAWTHGSEAASPAAPDCPASKMPICYVYCRTTMTKVVNYEDKDVTGNTTEGYIYKDVRPFLNLGGTDEKVKADSGGTAGYMSDIIDNFTLEVDASHKLKVKDRIELNIMLLAFKMAVQDGLVKFNMSDGFMDEFEDETGVDTANCTNQSYDSTNDLYQPTQGSTIDKMEYSSDANAQSAYAGGGGYGSNFFTGGSVTADGADVAATNAFDGNTSTYWQSHYPGGGGAGHWIKYDLGAGVTKTARKLRIHNNSGNGINGFNFDGSNNDSSWTTIHSGNCTNATGWNEFTFSNSTAYRYYRVYSTSSYHADAILINEIEAMEIDTSLQCYSEGTIKQEGSYSLKCVATTAALNKTLTKTIGSPLDLSNKSAITFWVRASRTGTNLQLQIHDSGGTTSTKDINIATGDTWQQISWDISGISNANKDAIDNVVIKVTNADASNTFYIDDIVTAPENMTLVSNAWTANAEPTQARIVVFEQDVDSVTVNTDLKAWVSIDGGSNYDQVTLALDSNYDSNIKIYTGIVDVTARTGTSIKWKVTTHNNKNLKVHGIGANWN